jgi:hypothetical protein
MRAVEKWLLVLSDPETPRQEFPTERLTPEELVTLCALADFHGVSPGVCNKVEKLLAETPDRLISNLEGKKTFSTEMAAVRKRLTERFAMTMFLSAETRRLLKVLSTAGAEVIALKGMDFATRLYTQPALRPFADIDLLTRRQDWDAIASAMSRLGYVERETELKHATGYAERTWENPAMPGAMVEVHDNLVNSPTIRRGVSVTLADVPLEKHTDGTMRPTAAGLLLIAAVHGAASHSFDKLQHLADVAQIARQRAGAIDENELKRAAEKTGAMFCIAMALDLAARTFNDRACAELLARLDPRWPRRRVRWLITPEVVARGQGPARKSASWRRQWLRQMLKSRR